MNTCNHKWIMAAYGNNWRKDFCKRCGAERIVELSNLRFETTPAPDHIDVTATVEVKTTIRDVGDPDAAKHLREILTGVTTED